MAASRHAESSLSRKAAIAYQHYKAEKSKLLSMEDESQDIIYSFLKKRQPEESHETRLRAVAKVWASEVEGTIELMFRYTEERRSALR